MSEFLEVNQTERKSIKAVPVFNPSDIAKIKKTELFISPMAHDSCIDGRFHWTEHPAASIKLIDEKTGLEKVYLTSTHIPKWAGGKEDTLEGIKVIDERKTKRGRMNLPNNNSFDDDVKQSYSMYMRNKID